MPNANPNPFRLQKWYLDCVSEAGEVFIGYCAHLQWGALKLSYASTLEFEGERSAVRTSLRPARLPVADGRGVSWESKRLACAGRWENRGDPLPALELYRDAGGAVVWEARYPLARVQLDRFKTGRRLVGLGYAERLDLTVPPWRLPIEDLLWGRFIAQDISLVWIAWRGARPLNLLYLNGEEIRDGAIAADGIAWPEGSLAHEHSATLREGYLVNTALKAIPGVKALFPGKIVDMHEIKWRSRSKLTLNGATNWGWTIHERVRF